jgi:uncharacterized protein
VSTHVEKLLVLQERDRKISRLSREIKDLPARQKMIDSRLDQQRKAVSESEDLLRKATLRQKEMDAEINEWKEKIKKLREQQMTCKNNDDYKAIERQIFSYQKEIKSVEEKQIALMEANEDAVAERDRRAEALATEEKVVSQELAMLKDRVANIEKQIADLQAERDKVAAEIEPEWLSRYQRIFERRHDFAIVPVNNGTCGGCHMKLPPQVSVDARRLDTMTSCSYCGRLLYIIP